MPSAEIITIGTEILLGEISKLRDKGIFNDKGLKISKDAHVIMPYHKTLDAAKEEMRGTDKIGTTGRGIGPAYADKVSRSGIRIIDLLNDGVFKAKLKTNVEEKNKILKVLYGFEGFSFDKLYEEYARLTKEIKGFVSDTASLLSEAARKKK